VNEKEHERKRQMRRLPVLVVEGTIHDASSIRLHTSNAALCDISHCFVCLPWKEGLEKNANQIASGKKGRSSSSSDFFSPHHLDMVAWEKKRKEEKGELILAKVDDFVHARMKAVPTRTIRGHTLIYIHLSEINE
jgi:hypothetical protein